MIIILKIWSQRLSKASKIDKNSTEKIFLFLSGFYYFIIFMFMGISNKHIHKVCNEAITQFMIEEGIGSTIKKGGDWLINGFNKLASPYMAWRTDGKWNEKYGYQGKAGGKFNSKQILKYLGLWFDAHNNKLSEITNRWDGYNISLKSDKDSPLEFVRSSNAEQRQYQNRNKGDFRRDPSAYIRQGITFDNFILYMESRNFDANTLRTYTNIEKYINEYIQGWANRVQQNSMNGARQILSPSKEARLVASHLSLKAFLSTDIGKRCANGDWGNNNQQQAQGQQAQGQQQGQSRGQQQAQQAQQGQQQAQQAQQGQSQGQQQTQQQAQGQQAQGQQQGQSRGQQQAQQAQQGQSQGQQQAQGQQNSQYGLPQYKKLRNGSNLSPSDISRAKEYFKNNPNAKRMQTSDGKNFIFRNKDGHLISAPIGDTGNQAFIEALKRRKKMITN